MANEFQHTTVGPAITQAEFETAGGGHQFDSQATGDLLHATSASNLARLPIGSADEILTVSGGLPVWSDPATVLAGTHVYKASDESVAASTTLQADDDLTFSVEANSTYYVEGQFYVNIDEAGDFKWQATGPASVVIDGIFDHDPEGTTTSSRRQFDEAGSENVAVSATADYIMKWSCIVITAGTAGSFGIDWAQVTASGTATMNAGSTLVWKKVA